MKSQRCAIYARFSSDRQSPTSIVDQIRKCRDYASLQNWPVLDDHVYIDAAITGTSMERPGLQGLLSSATDPARPFDCILIDDSSRLSRRAADTLMLYERLAFSGIRVVAVSQGVDTDSPQAELLVGVHGLIDSVYSRELAQKTHRGLEGRALKGLATGGRCFGYRTVGENAHLEIDEHQAEIVLRIFEMYADGQSLKSVARQLNREGVQSPKIQRGRLKRSWCMSSVRVILLNERYRGRATWNKTRKVRDPNSGRRVKRARPQSEWITSDAPHLRIVSEDLWQRVRRRFKTLRDLWGREGRPGLNGQQHQVYLFSGLLECGECGGSVTLVSGRWRTESQQYGCSVFHQRGETVCANQITIRRNELELRLLEGLQEKVLSKEAIAHIVLRLQDELMSKLEAENPKMSKLRNRKQEVESEIERLTDAIAAGEPSQSIVTAIRNREAELRVIDERLVAPRSAPLQLDFEGLRRFALSRLTDLRTLLSKSDNVCQARAVLAERMGKIRLFRNGAGGYVARGAFDFFGANELRVSGAEGQS